MAKIDGKLCMRAYTPVTNDKEVGYFELLVKVYFKGVNKSFPQGGLMSQHLDSLQISDTIDVKGPLGHIHYLGQGSYQVDDKRCDMKTCVMLADVLHNQALLIGPKLGHIMMDMQQHNGGPLPSNSLQFSPQSALSNENLFLLDPSFSSSLPMDLCGLNPSFSSHMSSDFSLIFMDSAFPNSLGFNMGSSMESLQGQGQSTNGFYAADEWSGTTNSASGASNSQQNQQPQQQQQQHMSTLGNQPQSMHAQSSVHQSMDVKPKLHSFESSLSHFSSGPWYTDH